MADEIAKMRAALNDGASVMVMGAPPEFNNVQPLKENTQALSTKSPISVPSLDDISNFLQKAPEQFQRFLTNPQAFTELFGQNKLPEQTGFAASATGLPPKNPNSLFTPEGMAYDKGYEAGEPVGIAGMAAPLLSSALKPTSKMLAEMVHDEIMRTGNIKLSGLPEIPVANFAVKPKGGDWSTGLGAPLEQSGGLGQYLTEKTQLTPINFFNKIIEPANLTPTQRVDFERALEDIPRKYHESPNFQQDVMNSLKEYFSIHNKVFPEQAVSVPTNIDDLVKAKNEWLLKNFRNYIEKEMGTGLPHDSVLSTIEKYNRPLHQKGEFDIMFGSDENRAADARKWALRDYEFANDQANKYAKLLPNDKFQTYDLNSPQFANVGKQTAQTEPGKIYENMTDFALNRLMEHAYNKMPYGEKLPRNTVVKDLQPTYTRELGFDEILNHVIDKLISGEYKPENLKNKAVSSVVSDIFEGKIAEEKALSRDKDAYHAWVQHEHNNLPSESPMMGIPTTAFPDNSKLVLFDATYAKDNPDMLLRQLSVDTKDLNHCVSHCGHNEAKNYPGYAPNVEPHTGVTPTGGKSEIGLAYPNSVKKGESVIGSLRDPSGHAQATLEFKPDYFASDYDAFKVKQIMGLNDKEVNPVYQSYIKSWLNKYADRIRFVDEDHGLNNISAFDLRETKNPHKDFLKSIHEKQPLISDGMLNTLFGKIVSHLDTLEPGLLNAYNAGYVNPVDLFSKFLPRFFDTSDLLSLANKFEVDIMEHAATMSKPHIENAADIITKLENQRNMAEKIGDISASDEFTKLIQQVTNRIIDAEQ